MSKGSPNRSPYNYGLNRKALSFENMVPMPLQKRRMRPLIHCFRHHHPAFGRDQPGEVLWNYLRRKEDTKPFVNSDQPSIEEPVKGACECKSIPHRIGAFKSDRPDVGCLNLWAPTPVNEAKTRDGAGVPVGFANLAPKSFFPKRASHLLLNHGTSRIGELLLSSPDQGRIHLLPWG